MVRHLKFSLTALFVAVLFLAGALAWFTHERQPRVNELLYGDVTGLHEYHVMTADCGIHSEAMGAFFLTFIGRAEPADTSKHNKPYIEVSLLFKEDPRLKIVKGTEFPVVLRDKTFNNLQCVCYYDEDVWEDFENATVTINSVSDSFVDATLEGTDSSGNRVSMRAKFNRNPKIHRSFSRANGRLRRDTNTLNRSAVLRAMGWMI